MAGNNRPGGALTPCACCAVAPVRASYRMVCGGCGDDGVEYAAARCDACGLRTRLVVCGDCAEKNKAGVCGCPPRCSACLYKT